MSKRIGALIKVIAFILLLGACSSPNPQPPGLTPIPTLAPGATLTLVPAVQVTPVSATQPVTSSPVADAAALGAPLFEKNCSPCHGVEGEGVTGPALRNNQFVKTQGDAAAFQTIANGRSGTAMPAWLVANGGRLADTQIDYVIAFLHTLQDVPPLPTATPMPPVPTDTPMPANAPTSEPARPSLPGNSGNAIHLSGDAAPGRVDFGTYCSICHGPEGLQGSPNPGSDDGSVPVLNPIDSTIANPDKTIFATNVDLFIEHGSIPSGSSPLLMMPSFGDSKMLTDQQIADLIAYIISLNSPQ